jgi:plasmid stabilization system protein ParE
MSDSDAVRYTDQANADLDEIAFWLRLESEALRDRFLAAAQATAKDLTAFPNSGFEVSFGDAEVRDCRWALIRGFRNHLLIYRGLPEGIQIVRIIHGWRDLDELRSDS